MCASESINHIFLLNGPLKTELCLFPSATLMYMTRENGLRHCVRVLSILRNHDDDDVMMMMVKLLCER